MITDEVFIEEANSTFIRLLLFKIFVLDHKGPFIYDVSHFGGRGGQSKSDILLTHAVRGGGAQSILYKIILWMGEKMKLMVQIMK